MPATKPTIRMTRTAPPRRAARRFMSAGYRNREGRTSCLAAQPDAGILPLVVDANLEMQVGPRRVAGGAFVCNQITARDDHSALHAAVEPRQVAVERRIAVAVCHGRVVAVAVRTGIEVHDPRVGGDDRSPVNPGDVEPGVDAMWVRTARIVHLEPVAVAAGPLADASRTTGRHRPFEYSGSTTRRPRLRLILLLKRGDLGVDRCPLRLNRGHLRGELALELLDQCHRRGLRV